MVRRSTISSTQLTSNVPQSSSTRSPTSVIPTNIGQVREPRLREKGTPGRASLPFSTRAPGGGVRASILHPLSLALLDSALENGITRNIPGCQTPAGQLPVCCKLLAWCHPPNCVCVCRSLQSCPALCNPMDCSLPGFSVHGILQARILERVFIPSSRGVFPTQGSNPSFPHCRQILYYLSHRGSPFCL